MILTDDHIFIHMPKTGGTWVQEVLRVLLGATKKSRPHAPIWEDRWRHPEVFKTRTPFGVMRDPWSWYLSFYQYIMAHPVEIDRVKVYCDGNYDFKSFIEGLQNRSEDNLPDLPGIIWRLAVVKEHKKAVRKRVAESPLGFWGFIATEMYDLGKDTECPILLQQATLRSDLEGLLGLDIPVGRFPPKNTRHTRPVSALEDPRDLYREFPELVDLIAEVEGPLIERFGYEKPVL